MITTREFSILHIKADVFNILLCFSLKALFLHQEEKKNKTSQAIILYCLL